MQESDWARILEPALHAAIASRCHRAYRHDLKNGLQGIYGGFDALHRLLQMPVRDLTKVERTNDFVRQAINGHEKSLERVLHGLSPLEQPPERIDVTVLLQELVKFLINDAAAQRVSIRGVESAVLPVQVRPAKLRLVVLSLMIDAIDAMPVGGSLQVSTTLALPWTVLELTDTRATPLPENPWVPNFDTTPSHHGWTLFVARHLILAEAGGIECETLLDGGRKIRITLPAAI